MNDIFLYWPADECKGLTYQEKNKRASEKWKEQNDSQRKKFVDSAKVYKELNVKVSERTHRWPEKETDLQAQKETFRGGNVLRIYFKTIFYH